VSDLAASQPAPAAEAPQTAVRARTETVHDAAPDGSPDAVDGPGQPAEQKHRDPIDLGRIAWLGTSLVCVVTAVVVLLEGYYGYAGVTFAVAAAAAINLL
jgi:hypothetical protein